VRHLRSDGEEFADTDWDDPAARSIMFVFGHRDRDTFALLLNASENGVEFTVPKAPFAEWELVVSSDLDQAVSAPVTTLVNRDCSFTLLRSRRA